jgi:hypothetical protein
MWKKRRARLTATTPATVPRTIVTTMAVDKGTSTGEEAEDVAVAEGGVRWSETMKASEGSWMSPAATRGVIRADGGDEDNIWRLNRVPDRGAACVGCSASCLLAVGQEVVLAAAPVL